MTKRTVSLDTARPKLVAAGVGSIVVGGQTPAVLTPRVALAGVGQIQVTGHPATIPGSAATLFTETFPDNNLVGRGFYDFSATPTVVPAGQGAPPGIVNALECAFLQGAIKPSWGGCRRKFTESESVYLRFWIKYSPNWVGSGEAFQPHELSFMTNQNGDFDSPAFNKLTIYIEHAYQNGGFPVLSWQDAANIVQGQVFQDLRGVTEVRSTAGCNEGSPDLNCYLSSPPATYANGKTLIDSVARFSPNPGPAYKGDWRKIEVYCQLNSILGGIGQSDGIFRYWFNGALVREATNLLFRTGQHPTMMFNQFLILPYMGNGSPATQSSYIANLFVATGRPTVPAVPTVGSMHPNSAAPGAIVNAVGTDYVVGATRFTVGGLDTDATVVSPTSAQVTIPAGAGTVDVVAITEGGSGMLEDGFTYGGSFQTPNIVNNVTFAAGQGSFRPGWGDLHHGAYGTPTFFTRENGPGGLTSARRDWSVPNAPDAQMYAGFYPGAEPFVPWPCILRDRIWAAMDFYIDAAISGSSTIAKFMQIMGSGFDGFGGGEGLYVTSQSANGVLGFHATSEHPNESTMPGLATVTSLLNAWHRVEVEFWRNGHPSGNPAFAIWLDNVNLSSLIAPMAPGASMQLGADGVWRYVLGIRAHSDQIGSMRFCGVMNPGNNVDANCWLRRISISSLGRIGP